MLVTSRMKRYSVSIREIYMLKHFHRIIFSLIFVSLLTTQSHAFAYSKNSKAGPHHSLSTILATEDYEVFLSNYGNTDCFDGTAKRTYDHMIVGWLAPIEPLYVSRLNQFKYRDCIPFSGSIQANDIMGVNLGILVKKATADATVNFTEGHKAFIEQRIIPAIKSSNLIPNGENIGEVQLNYYLWGYSLPKLSDEAVTVAENNTDIAEYMRFERPHASVTFRLINGKPDYDTARKYHFGYSLNDEFVEREEVQEMKRGVARRIRQEFSPIREAHFLSPAEKTYKTLPDKAEPPTEDDVRFAMLRAFSQNGLSTISDSTAFVRGGAFLAVQAILGIDNVKILNARQVDPLTYECDLQFRVSWKSRKNFLNNVYPANFGEAQKWSKKSTHQFTLTRKGWISPDLIQDNTESMFEHQDQVIEAVKPESIRELEDSLERIHNSQ